MVACLFPPARGGLTIFRFAAQADIFFSKIFLKFDAKFVAMVLSLCYNLIC